VKNKLYIVLMFGFIAVGILYGCGTSSNEDSTIGKEVSYYDIDYTTNDDGTYTYNNNIYKYKIEVSGIEGESRVTFIILTNDEETSFEDISYSLIKAELNTGVPEFVILGWY